MAVRTAYQIESIAGRSKANMFAKMMGYASELSVGVAAEPALFNQSNLIWGMTSLYATLDQKNVFANIASGFKNDVTGPDGLGAPNLFEPTL